MGKICSWCSVLPPAHGCVWLARCGASALDLQILTDTRAYSGSLVEWPLSEGGKLLPPRQGHAGLLSLSSEETGEKSIPIQQPLEAGRDQLPPGKGQTVSDHE